MPDKKTEPQVIVGDAFTIVPGKPFRLNDLPSIANDAGRRKVVPEPQPGPPPATEVPKDQILPRAAQDDP